MQLYVMVMISFCFVAVSKRSMEAKHHVGRQPSKSVCHFELLSVHFISVLATKIRMLLLFFSCRKKLMRFNNIKVDHFATVSSLSTKCKEVLQLFGTL